MLRLHEDHLNVLIPLPHILRRQTSSQNAEWKFYMRMTDCIRFFFKDNGTNLMKYIAQLYCDKKHGGETGDYTLPDPYAILAAAQVNWVVVDDGSS